jgi:bifunctional UDP-N-acetylglucosamine pyrophosphorylase/glucosamine-1-phosphate N-acetyltransferase
MDINVLILAGGKGSRTKTDCPKILLNLAGKPVIDYVLTASSELNPLSIEVVIPDNKIIMDYLINKKISFSVQEIPKGTAHALMTGLKKYSRKDMVLVINGDVPLITRQTLEYFIKNFYSDDKIAFISTLMENPVNYGRVIRDEHNNFLKIVEEKDLKNSYERAIKEINTGIYLGKAEVFLNRLANVNNLNSQGEYYLTDALMPSDVVYLSDNSEEFLGINTLEELSQIAKILWLKRAKNFMKQGVNIMDPQTFYVDETVKIDSNVVIYPNVFISGYTNINDHTLIYSGCRIVDSNIGRNCVILDNTLIESSEVGNNCSIGPMAHLRPKTILKGENKIGNFVETKKVVIGKKTKASHLTYLGDAIIGKAVNVGCGTITCNYDGFNKNETILGDNVFVGSDVQFVAPVKIGSNVVIAAGSTITEDVPDNALAIARSKQMNKLNWFSRWIEKMRKK